LFIYTFYLYLLLLLKINLGTIQGLEPVVAAMMDAPYCMGRKVRRGAL
jgi:hypothetical protein